MDKQFPVLTVGITGGIGSGKTTICNLFENLGVPIYNADMRAKILMNSDAELIVALKNTFGNDIYDAAGELQRGLLADRVFNNSKELNKLNKLVHPRVRKDFEEFVLENKDKKYIIQESALLIETGNYKRMDVVILVSAALETRIQRVMKRDACDREAVIARISNQMTEEEKRPYCQYVIQNNPGDDIEMQVEKLHQILCKREFYWV